MSEEYHLGELHTALDPNHPSHILPPKLNSTARVLDVGCGAGQTLIAAYPQRLTFGVDIDGDALRLGKTLTKHVQFVQARAEALPYRDGSFDMAVSRVALAYTDLSDSFREIHRVLAPGGKLWMTLHGFDIPWNLAKISNAKGKIFFLYVLLNSAALHLFGKQFRFAGRIESFQTNSGIERLLRKHGFTAISISRGTHFLVTAARDIAHRA